jgi:hypothetical protein
MRKLITRMTVTHALLHNVGYMISYLEKAAQTSIIMHNAREKRRGFDVGIINGHNINNMQN